MGWLAHVPLDHQCHWPQPPRASSLEGKGKGKSEWLRFGGVNHFNPNSPLYEKKDEWLILFSADLGLGYSMLTLFCIGSVRHLAGSNMLVWYWHPVPLGQPLAR